jgi:branched-chain amino acid transport system permease protein
MTPSSVVETEPVESPAPDRPEAPAQRWVDRVVGALGLVVALVVVLQLSADPISRFTAIAAASTAIAALGFYVVHQVGGATFGQSGAMAIGAYTSGLLSVELGWPVPLTMVLGVAGATVVGCLLGVLVSRARTPFHFILVTFTFSEVVRLFLEKWVYGADGLPNIPAPVVGPVAFDTPENYFWLAMGSVAVAMLAVTWLMSSNLARGFHTVKDGERHLAPSFGVGASTYKIVAFAIASALAGVGGVLTAHFNNFISPDQFNLQFSVLILAAAVLGGLTRVYGAVLGAFILTFLSDHLVAYPGASIIVYGVVLVVAMLVVPNGLSGLVDAATTRVSRLVSVRRGRRAE